MKYLLTSETLYHSLVSRRAKQQPDPLSFSCRHFADISQLPNMSPLWKLNAPPPISLIQQLICE